MNECSQSIRGERDCNFAEYWIRRVFSSLLYFRIYRKLYPRNPFYTPAAIRKIETLLNTDSRVFEWGSGISTIWFAKRVKKVISVENNEEWYKKGLLSLEKDKLNNVDLFFSPPFLIVLL